MNYFLWCKISTIVLILALQSCSAGLFSEKLEGTVVFQQNGDPVVGARITYLEKNNGGNGKVLGQTTTNDEGFFRMKFRRMGGDEWFLIISVDSLHKTVPMPRKQKTIEVTI